MPGPPFTPARLAGARPPLEQDDDTSPVTWRNVHPVDAGPVPPPPLPLPGDRTRNRGVLGADYARSMVVAHLDCDAFYVSVELQRRPELRGKPVVVVGSGPRAVVTTASYEARRFGVGSASPAAQARRLCPQAIFVPPDFDAYRATSKAVWALVRERLPVVQQVGLDEGYADVTDVPRPLPALRELVAEVVARTGIAISVGVGPNRLI